MRFDTPFHGSVIIGGDIANGGLVMPTLEFKGKQHIYAHHLTVPYRPLVADAGLSLNPADADDNLIIHGDNLHALKALLPRYAGRVKCIYIDPPYNTGNEGWLYNDNVNSPLLREWLKANSPVDGEDLERHDKWLCMMWPRLHLLKELLSDDGRSTADFPVVSAIALVEFTEAKFRGNPSKDSTLGEQGLVIFGARPQQLVPPVDSETDLLELLT